MLVTSMLAKGHSTAAMYPTAKRLISILIASFSRGFLSANSKGCGLGVRESGFAAVWQHESTGMEAV